MQRARIDIASLPESAHAQAGEVQQRRMRGTDAKRRPAPARANRVHARLPRRRRARGRTELAREAAVDGLSDPDGTHKSRRRNEIEMVGRVSGRCVGSTAQAQSSVTLYGVVDAGLLYQSTVGGIVQPDGDESRQGLSLQGRRHLLEQLGHQGHRRYRRRLLASTSSCRARSIAAPASSASPTRRASRRSSTRSRASACRGRSARSTRAARSCRWPTRWPKPTCAAAVLRQHPDRVARHEPGGGLARHEHERADRRAVRQQRDRLRVAELRRRERRARICAGRRRGQLSGRHARVGRAEVFELRPEARGGLLQRPRHQPRRRPRSRPDSTTTASSISARCTRFKRLLGVGVVQQRQESGALEPGRTSTCIRRASAIGSRLRSR